MSPKRLRLAHEAPEAPQGQLKVLTRQVSRMDGATLDRLWESALRGDMDLAEKILAEHKVSGAESTTPQWSETSSWLFGRISKK